jgi:hypothetical protein
MYSQAKQDAFALLMNGNKIGFYLDIGAGNGFLLPCGNNTLLLEESGWDGILIDAYYEYYHDGKDRRKGKFVLATIPQDSILDILQRNNAPKIIDYASMDIDPSTITILENFPFDKYEIKIITFEHDLYLTGDGDKKKSKKILEDLGFYCICDNVLVELHGDNVPFEDWWINPKYFNSEILNINIENKTGVEIIKELNENSSINKLNY